ncbi:hypothetical protein ACWDKQ_36270, partial [Saccharopolyspora sp. NPDC000995]
EKTSLLEKDSGSQTGDAAGFPGKGVAFTPSDVLDVSDVDPVFSVGVVDTDAVTLSGGDPVVSGSGRAFGEVGGKDGGGGKGGADGGVAGGKPARVVPAVSGVGQDRPGTPPPAYSDGAAGFGQQRSVMRPRSYGPVAGGDQVVGVVVSGGRPVDVLTSQTRDSTGGMSPAVTPHASGVPSDTALPKTITPGSGSIADPDSGAVFPGQETTSPSAATGQGVSSAVDSVVRYGDAHPLGGAAVLWDSVTLPAEGSQAAPHLQQNQVRPPAADVPVGTVRVAVPAEVVAGGGLAEFVRGRVADSTGGPVMLVSQADLNAGVPVSPGQASSLARGLGRDVVALTPGQGGRGPWWTVFGGDGSDRPVGESGGSVSAGGREGRAALAEASVVVPAGTAASGNPPVRQWVRGEIDRAAG